MTHHRPPVRYEDIETTPAAELLKLSYNALNELIREARRRAKHAETTADWLEGIKIEKSFREVGKFSKDGGRQHDEI